MQVCIFCWLFSIKYRGVKNIGHRVIRADKPGSDGVMRENMYHISIHNELQK